ncbi:MAG: SDR family oxidoreductase [Deltaproteobacteria bacterium]|nr:SDR family oxidoreductase [Deltaproteobacteria bacterium]
MIDQKGKVVLITGGTMGIGLATGLAYGKAGAKSILTYRWGTADLDEVRAKFRAIHAPEPMLINADVSNEEDTNMLLDAIAKEHKGIDVYVSNVAFALRISSLADYQERSLFKSIDYTSWPMWAYTKKIHDKFGRYPKYIVGLSSDGPDGYFMNYDFVAMSKAVLETMCRYMNFRLFNEGVRVNVVRSRLVRTESFDNTFGADFHDFLEALGGFEDCYTTPDDIANVILALGSGLLDAVGGQVIMADKGFEFFDNLMGIAERAKSKDKVFWRKEKKQ